MSVVLRVELETRAVERAEGDLAVAGFFESDRPLRGAAGRADWRLCGLVSKALLEQRCLGAPGEEILVPTLGRMRVPRVLFMGLGDRARFGRKALARRSEEAVQRGLDMGAQRLVLEALGTPAESVPDEAVGLLKAFLNPLRARPSALTLRLLVPAAESARTESAFRAAILRVAPREASFVSGRQQVVSRPPVSRGAEQAV